MFSSETIGELFVDPILMKGYSLSKISIAKFCVGDDEEINEIEIIKSIGRPFDDEIFTFLDTITSKEIYSSYNL